MEQKISFLWNSLYSIKAIYTKYYFHPLKISVHNDSCNSLPIPTPNIWIFVFQMEYLTYLEFILDTFNSKNELTFFVQRHIVPEPCKNLQMKFFLGHTGQLPWWSVQQCSAIGLGLYLHRPSYVKYSKAHRVIWIHHHQDHTFWKQLQLNRNKF